MSESGNQEIRKSGGSLTNKQLSEQIIAAAIAVHRALGPGFLESAYEAALCIELSLMGLCFERQKEIPIFYRGRQVALHRLDLLVEGKYIVELKACAAIEAIHFSIVRSYLSAAKLKDALIFNFASMPLTIKRVGPHNPNKEPTSLS